MFTRETFKQKPSWQTFFSEYTGWPKKSKPLPNFQKIVLNRIKDFHWD